MWHAESCERGDRRTVAGADVWVEFAGACAHARDGLAARALTPRAKLRWCGGRRLFDKLKGFAVHAGHEADRFGFWAVERILDVRRPARRQGRQLDVHVRFSGVDPLSKALWPTQWVPVTWLKADLRKVAREMEKEKVKAVEEPPRMGDKRSWAGLIWDGADEGRPRRGRSGDAARATTVASAADTSTAMSAADVYTSTDGRAGPVWATMITRPLAMARPLLEAGASAALATVQAVPISATAVELGAGTSTTASGSNADARPIRRADPVLAMTTVRPFAMALPLPETGAPANVETVPAVPIASGALAWDAGSAEDARAGEAQRVAGAGQPAETSAAEGREVEERERACGCGYGYVCIRHRRDRWVRL